MNPEIVYLGLMAFGGILIAYQLKLTLFPDTRGEIIGFENPISGGNCVSCSIQRGRMSVPVRVKTDSGEIMVAEIAPCSLCLNKLNVGSKVAISQMGHRTIALPDYISNLKGKEEKTWT